MKRLLVLVILVCSPAAAQAPGLSRDSIEIGGAALRLGMTKAQVAEKLTSQVVTKLSDDWWTVGKPDPGYGSVQFTNGRLSFADRRWIEWEKDWFDGLRGAVLSITGGKFKVCTLSTDTKPDPLLTDRVWLDCGEKSLVIVKQRFRDREGKLHEFASIYEQLGTWVKES